MEHPRNLVMRHRDLFRAKLTCKKPHLINYDLVEDPLKTYILPLYAKPGSTHFFVKEASFAAQTVTTHNSRLQVNSRLSQIGTRLVKDKFYYSRHVIEARNYPVPAGK